MRHPPDTATVVAPVQVIVNAQAGTGCSPEWAEQLERLFASHGLAAQVSLATGGPQILEAAAQAVQQRARLVVAAGGDGTVSAVASRVAGTGVALGIVPMGTLNHFARDAGIPTEDLEGAVAVIAQGHAVAVDAGEVNGRLFFNNSSLGLYPDIVADRESQRRRLGRGKWRALLAACLHAARRYPVLWLRIEVDGRVAYERRSAFIFVGNNEYRMEGFNIGERSALSGGQLSLYVTQRTGRFGLLRLALRALFHRLRQARDFDMLTAGAATVSTPQAYVRVAIDGEVAVMRTPLNYRVRPGILRLLVPRAHPVSGAPS